MEKSKAILLLNIGSPNSAKVSDVRAYLRQFLNDGRVIDVPALFRWFLVNCIIIPSRSKQSAKLYKQLLTKDGFPLIHYAEKVTEKLQQEVDNTTDVYFAMRYGKPNIANVLETIGIKRYKQLTVIPLFPQYASSSSGSAIQAVMDNLRKWTVIPELKIIQEFYNHPLFIDAFVKRIQQHNSKDYEHIIFSYHGLPIKHVEKMCVKKQCSNCTCEQTAQNPTNTCYKAACYQTTRLIAKALQLKDNDYTVSFQSRLSKNWLLPFTDKIIKAKARQGVKNILVVTPSFVADCLETTIEIGFEYQKLFEINGGKRLTLVESLNDSDMWIDLLKELSLS